MRIYFMKSFYTRLLRLIDRLYPVFFAFLALMTAFLCFRCLGIKAIDSWDEARHGISAYEMLKNGNFLVNTYLNEPDYWNVKPPVSFWSIMAGFTLFGYTSVGLRFFSALAYLITTVVTGLFARRYGKLTSLLVMAFLCANYFPFKAHLVRAGDADSLYLLFFTLAMLAMLKIRENGRMLYVCGLCFSLAFLTKSFHAGMIAAIGGLFLLLTGELRKMKPGRFLLFLGSALLPAALWAVCRFQYDGFTFFRNMYEADIAGRTAAGGLEGHGFPFSFYWTSIFWNFDYIYGWLTLLVIVGLICLWIRPFREKDFPLSNTDLTGLLLWFLVPFLGFSTVSTKLMWYVYPCIVPLCLLAAIFLGAFLQNKKLPAFILCLGLCVAAVGTGWFIRNNYLDNVRGARSNDLQTFVMEQFDRNGLHTGSTVYLDAYDPFLYANTTKWEQNMQLLGMMEGDLTCQDGGTEGFLADSDDALLILSVPFLADHPELKNCQILADNGQYLLLEK